jgi:hypothetical protein
LARRDYSFLVRIALFGKRTHTLFIAESFGRCDRYSVAGGQQTGEERAQSEKSGGGEEIAGGKGALHPVGENRAKKAVHGEAEDHARGRADQRDARGDPQDIGGGAVGDLLVGSDGCNSGADRVEAGESPSVRTRNCAQACIAAMYGM